MNIKRLYYILPVFVIFFVEFVSQGKSQEAAFELPLQLVGFPFIIAAVRITNFVKKLSYAISPATYRSRTRRELTLSGANSQDVFDVDEAEKYIVGEFGEKACIYERVCAMYAARSQMQPQATLDWPDVFKEYKRSPDQTKEYFLLSVFLGDIVGSPQLCHQLGKRRNCDPAEVEINK